ncbi:glucuronate isomerase [Verrucomicrobiota bacterium]
MASDIFITDDFLLETKAARILYHEYAAEMPIVDYHCHLQPKHVAEDLRWENITQIWLSGDHYKWRAMRSNGVPERFCTGDASDWEKFEKWAGTVPYLLRNQLYNWTHLELKRYFGISDRLLGADTAREIWEECNERIKEPDFSARGLMKQSNVVLVCTTDDPVDDLGFHKAIAADESFGIQVLPTWRPDKGMAVEDAAAFNAWVDKLGAAADTEARDFGSYMSALRKRHEFFHSMGCRLSDHGLETAYGEDCTESEAAQIFKRVRGGKTLSDDEILKFKSAMLYEFGVMDHGKGWVQQYHFGAMRNNNSRMFKALGPDTGFDSIVDLEMARPLSRLLDRLDSKDQLAKTILYNLNPCHNALLVTMLGNFQDGTTPGKMQHGSAWWALDQKDGMERQMEDLSQNGLLSRFVGMLTDSRSFLSYTRHEYFRRILCNMLGNDIHRGFMPDEIELVGNMVRDICYNNAARYFGFDIP